MGVQEGALSKAEGRRACKGLDEGYFSSSSFLFFFFPYVQNVELRIHPGAALIRSQIAVALTIGGESLQNATVRVTECNVTIGKLDIKTGGTMAR
jgi:hypothetical protein